MDFLGFWQGGLEVLLDYFWAQNRSKDAPWGLPNNFKNFHKKFQELILRPQNGRFPCLFRVFFMAQEPKKSELKIFFDDF